MYFFLNDWNYCFLNFVLWKFILRNQFFLCQCGTPILHWYRRLEYTRVFFAWIILFVARSFEHLIFSTAQTFNFFEVFFLSSFSLIISEFDFLSQPFSAPTQPPTKNFLTKKKKFPDHKIGNFVPVFRAWRNKFSCPIQKHFRQYYGAYVEHDLSLKGKQEMTIVSVFDG